jgi:predicted Zn-dependent protease
VNLRWEENIPPTYFFAYIIIGPEGFLKVMAVPPIMRARWLVTLLAASLCAAAQAQSTSADTPPNTATYSATNSAASPAAILHELTQSINTGHAEAALARIKQLEADHTAIPGLTRVKGLALYATENLQAADAAFAAALKEDPTDTESAQMRGLTLFRLGRPADAIPLLEPSRSKTENGKADPNYVLGLCYMDARRYDDARHAFAEQYSFPPDGAAAYLVTARMLLRREFIPVSQQFAQKAIDLDPNLPMAHELLGEIALVGNHLDEAITQLEAERQHNPLEGSVYDRLGDAYVRAGKYDEAQRSLQEAILLEPNSTGPYILLGKTMLKKSDPLAAATYLEHAVQMDPANYMTHSLLGQAYRAMGRPENASRETATAEKLQSASNPETKNSH